MADWNAISTEWTGFLSHDRKNDMHSLIAVTAVL